MKKPNLQEQFENIHGMPAYRKVNRNGIRFEEPIREYCEWLEAINSEMINALVQANDYIIETAPDDNYPEWLLIIIEQALKKSGCV